MACFAYFACLLHFLCLFCLLAALASFLDQVLRSTALLRQIFHWAVLAPGRLGHPFARPLCSAALAPRLFLRSAGFHSLLDCLLTRLRICVLGCWLVSLLACKLSGVCSATLALGCSGPWTLQSSDTPILTAPGLRSPIALAVADALAQASGQSLRLAALIVVRFGFRSFRFLVAPGGSIL